MPTGLKFQREHPFWGYKLKYLYYCIKRRDILQKKVSYGKENSDKTVYVIKPDYQDGVEGLLSLVYKQIIYINHAKENNYISYVDWKNFKTQYYDGVHNAWNYFFEQPTNIEEKDVYSSKNVILSGWTYKNINSKGLFEKDIFFKENIRKESSAMLKSNLSFSKEVLDIVENESKKLDISNCIGLYVRGTDYTKLKPSGDYIQPNIDQVKQKVNEFVNKYNSSIFLVTEDGEIYDELVNEFKEKIKIVSFDSFVRNYNGKEVLSKSNLLEDNKKDRGQKYLAKMILLSECKYLVSSITQGSKFSYSLNDGKYKDEYIFDLGLYD
jgi:hypothetical protein